MVFSIKPSSVAQLSYLVQRRGRIKYRIEAERAIGVYIVDSDNLTNFMNDWKWEYEQGHGRRRLHEGLFKAPYTDTWTILIWNETDFQIAVSYEISA